MDLFKNKKSPSNIDKKLNKQKLYTKPEVPT